MEITIWCDESDKTGKYYSNFYGGALVRSRDLRHVQTQLEKVCREQNLFNELKWQRVTENYLSKYKALMDVFFALMAEDKLKMRVMFTQNARVPKSLTKEQRENEYFLLYYQFVKHAFGLQYCNHTQSPVFVRVYFDYLPDTIEKRQQFKEFIKGLQTQRTFQLAKIRFRKNEITEVDSKKHLIMQCLDIVLGSMAFRLNDKHKEKPPGSRVRGKRTRAKEELYKYINAKIRVLYPGFNVGESTGTQGDFANNWNHPYRHWKFTSSDFETDEALFKP